MALVKVLENASMGIVVLEYANMVLVRKTTVNIGKSKIHIIYITNFE